MSYLLLHRWYVGTIALLFVAWVIVEIYERRSRPKREANPRDLYVDAPPWNDPRDGQRRDEEFRRQHPSRFG